MNVPGRRSDAQGPENLKGTQEAPVARSRERTDRRQKGQ